MINKLLISLKSRLARVNQLGPFVQRGAGCMITGSILKGKVQLGEGCRIKQSYLSGEIRVGRYTSIWGPNTDIYAGIHVVEIGNFCSIARNVSMQEYNHNSGKITTYLIGQNVFGESWENEQLSKGGISIGHDVWIGSHSLVLSGAKIGNGAVIAANSVVTGEIPPYAIAAGSPASVIKYRFSEDHIAALNDLQWWLWPVEKIKANRALFEHRFELSLLSHIK